MLVALGNKYPHLPSLWITRFLLFLVKFGFPVNFEYTDQTFPYSFFSWLQITILSWTQEAMT